MANPWNKVSTKTATGAVADTSVDPAKSLIQQQRMAKATNPYNGQSTNDLGTSTNVQDRPGKLQSLQEAPALTVPTEQPQVAKPLQQTTPTVADPNVQRIQQNLGSMAYKLQNKVNSFLQSGSQGIAGTAKGAATFKDGKWEAGATTTDTAAGIEPIVQQKLAEQKAIQTEMKDYFEVDPVTGEYKPKGFYQVLSQQAEGTPQVNSMLNIAEQLNTLENMNMGNSEEARELQRRLHEMDTDGLVTGLYRAKQAYEETFGTGTKSGLSWYGDSTTGGTGAAGGYNIADILGLKEEDIRKEVESATTMASGLFGGTFEAGLKQAVDTESESYKAALKEDAEVNNKLAEAAKGYFTKTKDALAAQGTNLTEHFKAAAEDITKQLAGDTSPEGQEVLAWVKKLSSSPDPTATIMNLMMDPKSGLNKEQRSSIGEYLGQAMFGQGGGKLVGWLTELSTKGSLTGPDGKELKVTAEQKAELMNKMASGKPEDAINYVRDEIVKKGMGINLEKVVEDATVSPETLDANMAKLTSNMLGSFKTFVGSQTEDAILKGLNIDTVAFQKLTPEQKSKLFVETLNKDPRSADQLIAAATNGVSSQLANFTAEKAKLDKTIKDKKVKILEAKTATDNSLKNMEAKLKEYQDQISSTISNNFAKVNADASRISKGVNQYINSKYGKVSPGDLSSISKSVAFVRRMAAEISAKNEYSSDLRTSLSDFKGILPANVYSAMASGASVDMGSLIDNLMNSKDLSKMSPLIDRFISEEPGYLATKVPSYAKYNTAITKAKTTLATQLKDLTDMDSQLNNTQTTLDKTFNTAKGEVFSPEQIMQSVISSLGLTDMGDFDPAVISKLEEGINAALTKTLPGSTIAPEAERANLLAGKEIQNYNLPTYAGPTVATRPTYSGPHEKGGAGVGMNARTIQSSTDNITEGQKALDKDGNVLQFTAEKGWQYLPSRGGVVAAPKELEKPVPYA